MKAKAVALHANDNVGTALLGLSAGQSVEMDRGGASVTVSLVDAIPFGHKFALADMASGDAVVKYGEIMGEATSDIARGSHVHVHNVKSRRGGAQCSREETS